MTIGGSSLCEESRRLRMKDYLIASFNFSLGGSIRIVQEFADAIDFFGLADGGSCAAQRIQRTQEAAVRLMAPGHWALPTPSGLAQRIQTTVVANTCERVGLHDAALTVRFICQQCPNQ